MSKQSGSAMNKKRRARSGRKTRTRKPKFLSLRLQFAGDKSGDGGSPAAELPDCEKTQLNLFPLHPENLTAAAAAQEENYVAAEYNFFSAAESGATSLTGLLGAPSTSASSGGNKAFSSSDSLRFTYGGAALARAALRRKERKPSEEEKWVSYSEVVENERKDEEVTSSASDLRQRVSDTRRRRLSLKLDYEEIISAWSNRGSLYIQPECPQTVPDIIHDDFFSGGFYEPSSSHGTWERNMSLYTVPEMVGSRNDGEKPPAQDGGDEEEAAAKEGAAAGQTHRAASVLRYKEKRQNRLFSKTIRYQVRKLNAEKRPRVKGRFVKRD
nr:zinc finger protein constans-like 16 [Ipomoea batatas]